VEAIAISPSFPIKTPLRYPGGKAKALKQIIDRFPKTIAEFREPFVGGGSVFIAFRQLYRDRPVWINDLNPETYYFWKCARDNLAALVDSVRHVKATCKQGKELFHELAAIDPSTLSEVERASRFFVLNRISFSGTIEAGGFSQKAFEKRFTASSIARLEQLETLLQDVKITNLDYSELLHPPGRDVFIFLDPPYFVAKKSKLYGKKGALHTSFDDDRFARQMQNCRHNWLITYDDSPTIRQNFEFANIYEWQLQYGMNNYKQEKAKKGNELFLSNYKIEEKCFDSDKDKQPKQLDLDL